MGINGQIDEWVLLRPVGGLKSGAVAARKMTVSLHVEAHCVFHCNISQLLCPLCQYKLLFSALRFSTLEMSLPYANTRQTLFDLLQ